MTVQLLSVSARLRLKYSLKSQKPASLTCESARLPAPIASTIRFGSVPPAVTIGARMPAAVSPATVADPTHTRITAVTSQARTSGSSGRPCIASPMRLFTPLATSTCLKAPEPPMTSRIEATSPIAAANVFITDGSERPRARPSVMVAKRSAVSITTSGSATNFMAVAATESAGTTAPPTAVTSKSTAGKSAVRMLTPAPGSSCSGREVVARPASGRAGIVAIARAKTGPASTSAGTAIARP